MLRVRLCGEVEIEADGRRLPDTLLRGRQSRLVVAYLVCERHRVVPRDELADLLWPERLPDSWATSLSAIVSKLRRLLSEAGLDPTAGLVSSSGGYQLALPADAWIDWDAAQQAVAVAETAVAEGDHAQAIAAATEALELAGRGFLSDACEWVDRQRAVAADLCTRAVIAKGEAHLRAGSAPRAVDAAREAVARDPQREAGYRLLMRALDEAGERAEALRTWERCRVTLVEELGVEPSAETESVYLRVLGSGSAPSATEPLPSGVVTFLLTDIVDSSALWDRHPTAMATALERHDAVIADIVARHGGALLKRKLEGDATVSVFARATAGALAAVAIRDALAAEQWPDDVTPTVRMAVHTGEAFERDGDYFGPALNRAARLRALAHADQILLSQAVAELVIDHLPPTVRLVDRGHRDLRGLARGENVSELVPAGDEPVPAGLPPLVQPSVPAALSTGSPFVGRDDELTRLDDEFRRVLRGEPRAVLVAGEPGVGKSRLAAEWAHIAHEQGAFVVYGRCDEGLGAPLQPFVEALRTLVPHLGAARLRRVHGIEELARLVPELALLLPESTAAARADPESERYVVFDALTRLLAGLSQEAPVVVVVDDLHWAGNTTLSLLRHVLRHADGARLLVVGTYRDTELGRTHPLAAVLADFHRDGTAHRLALTGLDALEVSAYLRAVGRDDRALGAELAKVTSGNPYFLIETLRHVEESGGAWDPDTLPQGVREATGRRLARLSDSANDMLSVAAVAGAAFALDLVEQVRGAELVDEIDEACDAGLVVEEPGSHGRFRFAHALVRQVLLAELVTVKRVRLHRRIAELLEAAGPGDDPDGHLSELAQHWFECASAGSTSKAVAACRRAAERAMERLAFDEAADLYQMATQALDSGPDDAEVDRAGLLIARCEALLAAGSAAPVRGVLADLEAQAAGSPRLVAWHATLAGQLAVLAEPDRLPDVVTAVGNAAVALRDTADVAGEAKAHYVHALALERLGRIAASEQALDRALVAARACGDRRLADAVLATAPQAALWGPSPVTRASGRCLDVVRVLRITDGAPAVEAVALRCQAALEALRGRVDAAQRMIGAARRTLEQLGLAHRLLETEVVAGLIELVAGRPTEAEAHLRPAFAALRDRGLDGEAAHAASLLGHALLLQGRPDEAEEAGAAAAALAGADLRGSIGWRTVLALVAAGRGDRRRALDLAHEAVTLASATDVLLLEADARLALADVLRATGDAVGADAETRRAVDVCERKGATALVAATRLHTGTDPPTDASVRSPGSGRRVGHNLATDYAVRATAALADGDVEAFVALHAEDCQVSRFDVGALRPEQLDAFVTAADVRMPAAGRATPLASLGDHLALLHNAYDFPTGQAGASWGQSTIEQYAVVEVGAAGLVARIAAFSPSQLSPAVAVLFRWFAETSTGADRGRTDASATALEEWLRAADDAVVMDVLALELDHVALEVSDTEGDGVVTLSFAPDGSLRDVTRSNATHREVDPFRNAVDEFVDRYCRAWEARDWSAVAAGYAPDFAFENRRSLVTASVERGGVETVRALFDNPDVTVRFRFERLATRGKRLALYRQTDHLGSEESGPAEFSNLVVQELDDEGRCRRVVLFDEDALDAAYDELDEWYAQGEAAPFAETWERARAYLRQYNTDTGHYAPMEVHDRRPVSLGDVPADRWGRVRHAWTELAADEAVRYEHVLGLAEHTLFSVARAVGTHVDGGRWEVVTVTVSRHDPITDTGQVDIFGLDQLDEARERFAELTGETEDPFRTRLDDTFERFLAAFGTEDPAARFAELHVDGFAFDDRRALAPRPGGDAKEAARTVFDESIPSGWELDRLATRGEHLGLYRLTYAFHSDDSGPAEVTMLTVVEADADGRTRAAVLFDDDALDAAYEELDDRYARGEAAPFAATWERAREAVRDYNAERGGLTDRRRTELRDHRPISLSEVPADRWGAVRQRWAEVVGEEKVRYEHILGLAEDAWAGVVRAGGTDHSGGQWEVELATVSRYDPATDTEHVDAFGLDQLDEARARFAEVSAGDPFRNAVDDTMDRFVAAMESHDRDALSAILGAEVVADDRRALAPWRYAERDQAVRVVLDDVQVVGLRTERLATRGRRLALYRQVQRLHNQGSGPADLSYLTLIELDENGNACATVIFDEDALDAAFEELDDRYARGDAAPFAATWERARAYLRQYNASVHPYARTEVHDRRPVSLGDVPADRWASGRHAWTELAADETVRYEHVLGLAEHTLFSVVSAVGTHVDGGRWEVTTVAVSHHDAATDTEHADIFGLDQLDEARARFAELAAAVDPFRNAVDDVADRFSAAVDAGRVTTIAELLSSDFGIEDRRTLAPMVRYGESDARQALDDHVGVAIGWKGERMATRGSRLALYRQAEQFATDGSGVAELTYLTVIEVDDDGNVCTAVMFDEDAIDAAYEELDDRYARGEAAPFASTWEGTRALVRGYNQGHTIERRVSLRDHRHASAVAFAQRWGVDRDRSHAVTSDETIRYEHVLGIGAHGLIGALRSRGTHDGGPWEIPVIVVSHEDPTTKAVQVELYDLHDLDAARIRFAEVVAEQTDPFHNAVDDLMDRFVAAMEARDADALASIWSAEFLADDRRKFAPARATGPDDTVRFLFDDALVVGLRHERLATRGRRLALYRHVERLRNDGSGPAELGYLSVGEVDEDGKALAVVIFDEDDIDAAYDELDDRYARGEAAPFAAAWAQTRRHAATYDADPAKAEEQVTVHDHRRTLEKRFAWPASNDTWSDLAGRMTVRHDHVPGFTSHARLAVVTERGVDSEGGSWEVPAVYVAWPDDTGHGVHFDIYDLDQLDEARARFAELQAETGVAWS